MHGTWHFDIPFRDLVGGKHADPFFVLIFWFSQFTQFLQSSMFFLNFTPLSAIFKKFLQFFWIWSGRWNESRHSLNGLQGNVRNEFFLLFSCKIWKCLQKFAKICELGQICRVLVLFFCVVLDLCRGMLSIWIIMFLNLQKSFFWGFFLLDKLWTTAEKAVAKVKKWWNFT